MQAPDALIPGRGTLYGDHRDRFDCRWTLRVVAGIAGARFAHQGLESFENVSVQEEESYSLACAPAHGRRRAAPAQTLVTLHKVGCSWFARLEGPQLFGPAGPTTRTRFEPNNWGPSSRQTGEPTVSHEGCSGTLLFLDAFLVKRADRG